MKGSWRNSIVLLLIVISEPALLPAQNSRSEQIQSDRAKKAQQLAPDEPPKIEGRLLYLKEHQLVDKTTSGISGVRIKIGGLVPGGGFALGPEFFRQDLANGNVIFRTAAQASLKEYERADLNVGTSRFVKHRTFFDFFTVYHNYPGINYYGPGPHSPITSRSDYRLEDTSIDGAVGARPVPFVKIGLSGGYLFLNVGPGTDRRFASSERIFTPLQAPGIDRQSDFLRYGAFTHIDYRDNPGGPRRGGNYLVRYDYYSDQSMNPHNFHRLFVDLQQFVPFFNARRVFAFRAQSTLTYTGGGQTVPFYLQPTLGGSEDLRGFRAFRFYDNNAMLLSGEYRWEVFAGLHMALFMDAGKVFPHHSQFNFTALEASEGLGFRFNIRDNVFMRIDTGFSREGAHIWIKFNDIFTGERIRTSKFD